LSFLRQAMSSMNCKKIDAVVLAGTHNTLMVEQNGERVPKPYLRLGGEPLVHYVCRVLARVPGLERLVVVGDPLRLRAVFSEADARWQARLVLVEEGRGILENLWRAFARCLLPAHGYRGPELDISRLAALPRELFADERLRYLSVLVATSDLPLLSPVDVEVFLSGVHQHSVLALGVVDYREMERLSAVLGEEVTLDSWKLGAIALGECPVRLGNLFFVRPFLADARLYPLLDEIYENRWLLTTDGRLNSRSWYTVGMAILRYCWRINPWWRFGRGMINLVPAMLAAALARATMRKAPWLSRLGRVFLSSKDVEFIGSLLIGARGQLVMNRQVGAALDIDVEEIFRFLEKRENFLRVASALRRSQWAFCGEGESDE
jgi:hypothetical protein